MAIGQHVAKYLAEKTAGIVSHPDVTRPEVDPEPRHAEPEPSMGAAMMMMAELLKAIREGKTTEEKDAALTQADLLQQILQKTRPENVAPPLMGIYANPAGERDDPKPDLKCPMYQVGYHLRKETLTPREIVLLNRLEPGEFRVQKSDGTTIPFIITARRSSDLKIERLDLSYDVKDDARHNHGSLTSYLEQILDGGSHESMFEELARLRAEVATAKAVAA